MPPGRVCTLRALAQQRQRVCSALARQVASAILVDVASGLIAQEGLRLARRVELDALGDASLLQGVRRLAKM